MTSEKITINWSHKVDAHFFAIMYKYETFHYLQISVRQSEISFDIQLQTVNIIIFFIHDIHYNLPLPC